VNEKKVPSITLPTHDYDMMYKMSNHAVVGVFRQNVLLVRNSSLTTSIPQEHDAYDVKRTPERVIVRVLHNGQEVFQCIFTPPFDY
jgi:hypothetical protein